MWLAGSFPPIPSPIEITSSFKFYKPLDWMYRTHLRFDAPNLKSTKERVSFLLDLKEDLKDLSGSWSMGINRSYIEKGIPFYGCQIRIDFSRHEEMVKIGLKYS